MSEHKPQSQISTLAPMAASSLHLDDYKRYGRQMILDGIGLPGSFAPEASLIFFIK